MRLLMGGVHAFVCACVFLFVLGMLMCAYVRMFVSGVSGFFIIINKAIVAPYLPHFPHLMFLSGITQVCLRWRT